MNEAAMVILSVGLSAIVSYATARLSYRNQKLLDYSFDYKKYLLEKRKAVYDKMDGVIYKISAIPSAMHDYNAGKTFSDQFINRASEVLEKAQPLLESAFWINTETVSLINESLDHVRKMGGVFQLESSEQEKIKRWAAHIHKLNELMDKLRILYFHDIMHLSKINRFINNNTAVNK